VIPDAVRLKKADWATLSGNALAHCGKVQSRIAILDVFDGFRSRTDPSGDVVSGFREAVGINALSYGTAYYPWLNSSIVTDQDVGYLNFDSENLKSLLKADGVQDKIQVPDLADNGDPKKDAAGKALTKDKDSPIFDAMSQVAQLTATDKKQPYLDLLNKSLPVASPAYAKLIAKVQADLNVLPPAAAMAGVYTMVDNTRGVWKAPANVSLNTVISPAVSISDDDQQDLNVDMIGGKSINAIRTFIGEGVLVWGARTLDGNSLDWRYVGVRRTMIFLEQSIKLATKAYVFENNVSTTWVTVKSMIRNFLTGVWKQGGLAGASPDDAFAVFCGLGETMTAVDILEGLLKVTVLVAVTRPAEFIEITFQQQLQKS